MRSVAVVIIALALSLLCVCAHAEITGFAGAPADPQTPGWHKLTCTTTVNGISRTMPFVLYLPETYSQAKQPWPMLVYLSGLGERGTDPQIMFNCGVPNDLARTPDVQKWMPMLILMPLCPADARWETPYVAKTAAALTNEVAAHWPVDANRVYLTGLSMGGSGCWSVAKEAPTQFAVVAPIVGNAFEPQNLARVLKGTGTTCLIISGADDFKSEPGSTTMAIALSKAGIDVVHAKVPFGDHCLWPWYYTKQAFYEWLLLHQRGQTPPADRAPAQTLMAMASERTQQFQAQEQRLNKDLQQVAQWWTLDNCGGDWEPGLHQDLAGRHNIFVTSPYSWNVPCRLQNTIKIPAAKIITLHLVVGHHPRGDWSLIVRVNEHEKYRCIIGPATAVRGWRTLDIDLTEYAGQEVRFQLVNAANGWDHEEAYWQSVQLVTK